MTNATNSASSATLTSTLTTTAYLAPSALNIFAVLAAGCYDEISTIEYKTRKFNHKHQLRHHHNYLYLQQYFLNERGETILNYNFFHNIISSLSQKRKARLSKFNDGKSAKEIMTEYNFSNKRKKAQPE
uniref:Uncharacterized protein n=1 Tax=Glossina palpalis gambiensis TaxID=67801 RepID=A0A1B0BVU8_9MUSC